MLTYRSAQLSLYHSSKHFGWIKAILFQPNKIAAWLSNKILAILLKYIIRIEKFGAWCFTFPKFCTNYVYIQALQYSISHNTHLKIRYTIWAVLTLLLYSRRKTLVFLRDKCTDLLLFFELPFELKGLRTTGPSRYSHYQESTIARGCSPFLKIPDTQLMLIYEEPSIFRWGEYKKSIARHSALNGIAHISQIVKWG